MRVRKKPVEVDAVEVTASNADAINRFIAASAGTTPASILIEGFSLSSVCINTLEGRMVAYPGDYLIRGVKGELYPCKADIFHATYDIVSD